MVLERDLTSSSENDWKSVDASANISAPVLPLRFFSLYQVFLFSPNTISIIDSSICTLYIFLLWYHTPKDTSYSVFVECLMSCHFNIYFVVGAVFAALPRIESIVGLLQCKCLFPSVNGKYMFVAKDLE